MFGSCLGRFGAPFDDRQAVVDLAKCAGAKGGVAADVAATPRERARGHGLPTRGPEGHPNWHSERPHIRAGPVAHIPVNP
jgi:hypothetical protein